MRARAVLLALLLLAWPAHAQAPRPGMRLTITRVSTSGGFTASAFLVVHTTTITRRAAPECGGGALRIEAEGHDASGRIRVAHLVTIVSAEERAIEIGAGGCATTVDLTLDDGSRLAPTRGTLRTHLNGANGLDGTLDSSVVDAAGVPTTVSGHIVLAPS